MILPEFVAFQGDNGKYLSAVYIEKLPCLQFSSDDPNDDRCRFQTVPFQKPGEQYHYKFKSIYFARYWRLVADESIFADASVDDQSHATLFSCENIHLRGNAVYIRNEGNYKLCQRDQETNRLKAEASNRTIAAMLIVKDLVASRKVYGVEYRMEDARVYGEKTFVAGRKTVDNKTDQEGLFVVDVPYEESNSYTFSRSVPKLAGPTIALEAQVPLIKEDPYYNFTPVKGLFGWSDKTTVTKSVQATTAVSVPAKSSVEVRYVGTVGTCDIPFNYTQEDTNSTDGTTAITKKVDGIFTGVNTYKLIFQTDEIRAI